MTACNPGQTLPSEIPPDGGAYCLVYYGTKPEYLLLALVLARRLAVLDGPYPLLVLPTSDVPEHFLEALRRAGCQVQPPTQYLSMHPALLKSPEGRHCKVLTKLQCLGLRIPGLKRLLLLDADLLPRRSLSPLLSLSAPAAMLMPANLPSSIARPLSPGELVPDAWLEVDSYSGGGARFNAGVMLLEPDPELLAYLIAEADPSRDLSVEEESSSSWGGFVKSVCGSPWRPSWTPEEDLLTRGLRSLRPGKDWTHLGAAWNFEVQGDVEYYPGMPIALEHESLDLDGDVAIFHFTGSRKPSWHAWFVGNGEMSIDKVVEQLDADHREQDPRGIHGFSFREWLQAFEELLSHARQAWGMDVLDLLGWSKPRPQVVADQQCCGSQINDVRENADEGKTIQALPQHAVAS